MRLADIPHIHHGMANTAYQANREQRLISTMFGLSGGYFCSPVAGGKKSHHFDGKKSIWNAIA